MTSSHTLMSLLFISASSICEAKDSDNSVHIPVISISGTSLDNSSIVNPEPLRDPRFNSSASAALLNTLQATRLEDVAEYFSGVQASSLQAGYNSAFMIRGFASNGSSYINGYRDNPRYFVRDPATIERFEIYRGHQSVKFGAVSPGGFINQILSKADGESVASLRLAGGNQRYRKAVIDVSGALENSGSRGRAIISSTRKDSLYEHAPVSRDSLYATANISLAGGATAGIDIDLQQDNTPYIFGTVYVDGQFLYDQSYVFKNASADKRYSRVAFNWQRPIADESTLQAIVQQYTTRRDDRLAGFYFKLASDQLVPYYRAMNDDYRGSYSKISLQHRLSQAHQLELGVEHIEDRTEVTDQKIQREHWYDYLMDPYAHDADFDLSSLPLVSGGYHHRSRESAVYLYDEYAMNQRWDFETGLRVSYFSQDSVSHDTVDHLSDHYVSSALSGSYQIDDYQSLYANASLSFEPNFGTDRYGDIFAPKIAEQIEWGYRRIGTGTLRSFASGLYCIRQANLLQRDPDAPGEYKTSGERRSCGVDLELQHQLGEHSQLKSSFSLMDAKITKDPNGALQGNTPASVPKSSGSLRLTRALKHFDSQIFMGIRAVSRREGNDNNTFKLPGFALFDLGVRYDIANVSLSLNARNLLDKRYIVMSNSESDVYQGERRQLSLELRYPSQ